MSASPVDDLAPAVEVLMGGDWVPAVVRLHGGTGARPTSLVSLVGGPHRGGFEVVTPDRIRPVSSTG